MKINRLHSLLKEDHEASTDVYWQLTKVLKQIEDITSDGEAFTDIHNKILEAKIELGILLDEYDEADGSEYY